jgi:general secretion pathway protein D
MGPAPANPSPAVSRLIVLNFDNADVEAVIQAAAEVAPFNYVLGPNVRGRKVTVQTTGKIPSDEIFNVLLTILDVNGLTAVRSGTLYRIIARESAPQSPVRTVVGREPAPGDAGDEIVTQIVPLRFIGATDAVTVLRPFVPAVGAVTAHRETNLLIVTDTAANVRRLLEILSLVDVELALDELQIIPIKHADAQELAQLVGQLFASGRLRTAGTTGAGVTLPSPAPPGPPPVAGAPTRSSETGTASERGPLIVAERRSNSLVVIARKQEMDTVRRLVEKLDVDIYGGQQVFIYFAENTKARDLATTLDAIYSRGDRGPAITGTQPLRPVGPTGPAGTSTSPVQPAPPLPIQPYPATRSPGLGTGQPGLSIEGAPPQAEVRFVADEVTNAVITTTYPRLWKEIETSIRKLDRMQRQVLIEVLAAEVTLTDDTKLGIEWAVRSGRFDLSGSPSGTVPGRPSPGIIPLGGAVPIGLNVFTFAADKFLAALNALATENKVNVLSNPSVMTTENKQAVINVSTSVPIVTSQQVPVATGGITGSAITQTVEYRDAGVILTVTPRIGEQGTVALDVKQEVNEVGAPEPPPINSPRFTKREAETSVVLLNNQTLVLGGLIQTKRTANRTGIPFLNRIPILGLLFGSTEEKIERTELVLLITPRVVGTAVDAARITGEMRKVTPELEEAIRRAPRPPANGPTP